MLKMSNTNPKETRKIALITGITGEDGSHLAELLLEKGYEVHGIVRRRSSLSFNNSGRINSVYQDEQEMGVKFFLHYYGDFDVATSLMTIISKVNPTEIYNLCTTTTRTTTSDGKNKISLFLNNNRPESHDYGCDGVGVLSMLDAIRSARTKDAVRLYHASTSELYGKVEECYLIHPCGREYC